MKQSLYLLILFFSFFSKAFAQSSPNDIITCLNNKLAADRYGLSKLNPAEEKKASFKEISPDITITDADTTSLFLIKSYNAVCNYNKHNMGFKVVYYYCPHAVSAIRLEEKLRYLHDMTIQSLDTERIARLNRMIIKISVDKKFEDSFQYLNALMNDITLEYVNNCSPCKDN